MSPPVIALLSRSVDMAFLKPAFEAACPGVDLRGLPDLGDLAQIEAATCWQPPPGVLATLPNLRLLQSAAAGIDHLTGDPTLPTGVPLCRIVDSTMASGMAAYVTWAVVQQQRQLGTYRQQAAEARWQVHAVQPTRQHRVGIAGLGTLGAACAGALRALGYTLRGWRRSATGDLPEGVELFTGDAQRDAFLAGCDTLVNLLPLTDATRGVLNAPLFAQLPRGAHLVNVGRGEHLVEADLLAALDSGQLAAATLDAFSTEPLPAGHPFWRHPQVTVTPHIATRTTAAEIARQTLANLAAVRAGRAPAALVDLNRGY
ncbi:MAG TPA: glyoxylate/hydroxypyruvate reductase A [Aquabacterium sp.]|nr:glyoxylate/hydroxypyruvate reductase A [Aquabacterium sp.]